MIPRVLCLLFAGAVAAAPASTRALIVDGQNNHSWQTTTPPLKKMLEETGLFAVDVATTAPKGGDMSAFRPDFKACKVVVLNYNGDDWPEATRTAFVDYVRSGGGVVVYHAANNAFPQWKEFNEITALGGWAGRNETAGPMLLWRDGKVVLDTKPGRAGHHGKRLPFQVVTRDSRHPITRGLPETWMHVADELYDSMRGPAKNVTLLATAWSDPANAGTGEHEPMLFTVAYGKGRVFHTMLGHDPAALTSVGFQVTFTRGAEWAATGAVTQKVPADFPGPRQTSVRRAQVYQPTWDSLDKRPSPVWFTGAKFGIFIHWGVYSVPSYAPVIPGRLAYAEWYWNAVTQGQGPKANPVQSGTWAYHQKRYGAQFPYQDFAPQFRAELYDPDHWADVFARSGARYVVLTSKHHEGYALWPSAEASRTWGRPWNSVEIGPQRDLLGDLTGAVRRKGLRMGFYYSLYEWYNPLWLTDKPRYIREHMIPQFKDLVTRYQPSIIFSDGEWDLPSADWRSPELLAWLFNETGVKDEVVINDRWGKDSRHKHGGYWTTEYTPGMATGGHPWEESRGMGFSYGYNRAERLQHYHTGRDLVIMLADLVSRGGNLLLDIGPGADGTIPVIMEQRLIEIGEFLKVNGEAIYGTKPWKATRQWSAGEVPKTDYNKEYSAAYDVTKLTGRPEPGKAGIEAFFTAKGKDVFAILPRWPGSGFQVKDVTGVKSAALLGYGAPLKFTAVEGGVSVELPALPEELMRQPAWVLKLSQ